LIIGLKESSGADIKRIQTHSYDKACSWRGWQASETDSNVTVWKKFQKSFYDNSVFRYWENEEQIKPVHGELDSEICLLCLLFML